MSSTPPPYCHALLLEIKGNATSSVFAFTTELIIWTGRGGSGKSTVLNQMALAVAEQGIGVLVYSP